MYLESANRICVPNLPPDEYFQIEKCPTAIHEVKTELINPEYLTFLCYPLLDEARTIFEELYKLELVYLAAILLVYGQFWVSTHASSMGLFKLDEFLARVELTNTADLVAKSPEVLSATEDPNITEKLKQMVESGYAKLISGSPYLTNARVVPKKKGPPRHFHSNHRIKFSSTY